MSLQKLFDKLNDLTPQEKAELERQSAQAARDAALLRGGEERPTTTGGVLARIPGDVATQMGAGAYRGLSRMGAGAQFVGAQFSEGIGENMRSNLRDVEAVQRASSGAAQESALPPIVSESVGSAAESLTMMAPGVVAAPVAGALGASAAVAGKVGFTTMAATFGAVAAAQASREAHEHGFTPNEARLYVTANALVEPLIMAAFNQAGLGGLEAAILRTGGATAAKKTSSAFVRAMKKNPNIAKFLESSAQEIPEELLAEWVQAGIQSAAGTDPAALDPDRLGESMAQVVISTLMTTGVVAGVQAPSEGMARRRQLEETKERRGVMQAVRRGQKERDELLARATQVGLDPASMTPGDVEMAETDVADTLSWGYATAAMNEDEAADPVDPDEEDEVVRGIIGTTLRLDQVDDASIATAIRALRESEPAYADMDAQQILEAEAVRYGPEATLQRDREQMDQEAIDIVQALQQDFETAAAGRDEQAYRESLADLLGIGRAAATPEVVNAELGKYNLSLDMPRERVLKALPEIAKNRATAERRQRARQQAEETERRRQAEREARAAEMKTIAGRKRQLMDVENLKTFAGTSRADARALAQARTPEAFDAALGAFAKSIGIEDTPSLSPDERTAMAKVARRALRDVPAQAPAATPEGAADSDLDDMIARNREAVDAFISAPSRKNMERMYSGVVGRMPRLGEAERQQLADRLKARKRPVVTRQIQALRKRAANIRRMYEGLKGMRKELTQEPPRIDDETMGGGQRRKLQQARQQATEPQRARRRDDVVGTQEELARQHRAVMRLVAEMRKDVEGAPDIPEDAQGAWERFEEETGKVTLTPGNYTQALKRLGMRIAPNLPPDQFANAGYMFAAAQYGEVSAAEWRDFLKRHGVKPEVKRRRTAKKAGTEESSVPAAPPKALADMTLAELQDVASGLKMKGFRALAKPSLILRIQEAQAKLESGALDSIEDRIDGANVMISVPIEGVERVPARYALIPIEQLVPSHNPVTYSPNQRYPFANTRKYESNQTYQTNVSKHAAALDEFVLVDKTFSPNIGPPIILANGAVLGGNSRAMALQRAREMHPAQFAKYEKALRKYAADFGLDPAEVPDGYVLVRVIDETPSPERTQRLIAIFNNTEVNAQSVEERGYTVAGLMTPEVIEAMGLDSTDEEVHEVVRRAGARIVIAAIQAGAIPPSARSELLNESVAVGTSVLSTQGTELLTSAIVAMVLQDAGMSVYQAMTKKQKELFIRLAVPSLAIRAKVENGELPGHADLIPDLQSVALAVVDRGGGKDVKGQLSVTSALTDKGEALFGLILEGIGRPAAFSRAYKAMATEIGEMGTTFDPEEDAFGGMMEAPPPYDDAQAIAVINKHTQALAALPRSRDAGAPADPTPMPASVPPPKPAPVAQQQAAPVAPQAAPPTPPPPPSRREGIERRIKERVQKATPKSEGGISDKSAGDLGAMFMEVSGSLRGGRAAEEMGVLGGFDEGHYKKAKPFIGKVWNEAGKPSELDPFVDAIYDKFVGLFGAEEAAAKIERMVPYLERFAEENNIGGPPTGPTEPTPTPPPPDRPTVRDIIAKYTRGGVNLEELVGAQSLAARKEIMQAIFGRPISTADSAYEKVLKAIFAEAGIPDGMWLDESKRPDVRDAVERWVQTGERYDPKRWEKEIAKAQASDSRIVTARQALMPKADESIIPKDLLPHLDEHQKVGAALALKALETDSNFLLADGTGTGKTRVALTAAKYFADRHPGQPVIIIAPNETIGKPFTKPEGWTGKWTPRISGSYADDSETMGFEVKLITDDVTAADLAQGGIWITNYHQANKLSKRVAAAGQRVPLLILDESHQVKNAGAEKTGLVLEMAARFADRKMFVSATPIDKIEHIHYLHDLINRLPEGASWWYRAIGFARQPDGQKPKFVLAKNVTILEAARRIEKVFDQLTKRGLMVKREISLKGYDIRNVSLEEPSEWGAAKKIIEKALIPWGKRLEDVGGALRRLVMVTQRHHMELFKVAQAIEVMEAELAAGRQVVLFANWVNESRVHEYDPSQPKGKGAVRWVSEGTMRVLTDYLIENNIPFGGLYGGAAYEGGNKAVMDDFRSGAIKVVIATPQSGGTGISLDDRTPEGTAPRSIIVLTAPYSAVELVQIMGRVWRLPTTSLPRAYMLWFGEDDIDQWLKKIAINKMRMLGASVAGEVDSMNPDMVNSINQDVLLRHLAPDQEGEKTPRDFPTEYAHLADSIEFSLEGQRVMPEPYDSAVYTANEMLTGREGEPVVKVDDTEAALDEEFEPEYDDEGTLGPGIEDPYTATPIEAASLFDLTVFAQMLQKGKAPAVVRHMLRQAPGGAGVSSREGVFFHRPRKTGMKEGSAGAKAGPPMQGIVLSSGIFIGKYIGGKLLKVSTAMPVKAQLELEAEIIREEAAKRIGAPLDRIAVRWHHKGGRSYWLEARERDDKYANYVLAHESWHLVDYLELGEDARGNIFGHIAAMKNYLKHTLASRPGGSHLTKEERQRIWKEAHNKAKGLKAANPKLSIQDMRRRFYREKIDAVIKFRGLLNLEQTKAEVIAISEAMRGKIEPERRKYRLDPAELFADLGAAIMLRPQWMKENYPEVYNATIAWLSARPSAFEAYTEARRLIESGDRPNNIRERLIEGFELGEEQRRKEREAEEKAAKRVGGWEWFASAFFDRFYVPLRRINRFYRDQGKSLLHSPQYAIERATYGGAVVEEYMKAVKHNVLDVLAKHEIPENDLNVYMFAKRVIGERADLANSLGTREADAQKMLDEIKARLGASRYAEVEQAAANFRTIRLNTVIAEMERGGHWSPELVEYAKANDVYVRFNATLNKYEIEHFEDIIDKGFGSGSGLKVFHQVGMLRTIQRPLTSTVEQDIRFLRAGLWNTAKRETVRALFEMKAAGVDEFIQEADQKYNAQTGKMEIVERKDAQHDTMYYMEDGKMKGVYVRPEVAKPFDRTDVYKGAHASWMRSWARTFVLGFPRALFTGKNPGFWLYNVPRDFVGTVARTPKLTLRKFFKLYWRAVRPSFEAAFGKESAIVDRMLREGSLISVVENKGWDAETARMEEILSEYGLGESKEGNALVRQIRRVGYLLDRVSRALEMVPKVGADMYLREAFPDMPDEVRAHMVRVRAGSPPFLRKGSATWATNDIALYSNAIIQGWAADIEAAKDNPGEYLLKRAAYSVFPAVMTSILGSNLLVMLAKALGADEEDEIVQTFRTLQRMYANITDYTKANFLILPPPLMGLDETGRTMFVRIPLDEFGRLFAGMTNIMIKNALDDPNLEKGIKEAAAMGWANTPSLNPVLGAALDAIQWFAMGVNPYDDFRQAEVLSQTDATARTMESHMKMLQHLSNKVGLGMVYRFKTNTDATPTTWFDKVSGTPFIGGNVVNRFIQVSGAGTSQELYELRAPLIREEAIITQKIERAAVKMAKGKPLTQEEEILLSSERGEARTLRMTERATGDPYRKVLATQMPRAQRDAITARIAEREGPGFDITPLVERDIRNYAGVLAKPRPLRVADRAEWEAERAKAIEWFRKRRISADTAVDLLFAEPAKTQEAMRSRYSARLRIKAALPEDDKK